MKKTISPTDYIQSAIRHQFNFFNHKRRYCLTPYPNRQEFAKDFKELITDTLFELALTVFSLLKIMFSLIRLALNLIICQPTAAFDNFIEAVIDTSVVLTSGVMTPIVPFIAVSAIITRLFVTAIYSYWSWLTDDNSDTDSEQNRPVDLVVYVGP